MEGPKCYYFQSFLNILRFWESTGRMDVPAGTPCWPVDSKNLRIVQKTLNIAAFGGLHLELWTDILEIFEHSIVFGHGVRQLCYVQRFCGSVGWSPVCSDSIRLVDPQNLRNFRKL